MVLFIRRLFKQNKYTSLYSKNYCKGVEKHDESITSNGTKAGSEHVVFGNKSKIEFGTGSYARLADGSVTATLGDTSVMATVVSTTKESGMDGLGLVVDYRQKAAAAGRIPTNFLRRELGQSEHEILTSRVIDRSLRPLFPNGYNYETQVVCNLLAVDGINNPDIVSINAASAALSVSDVPWNGPVSAVRVGLIGKEHVINPTRKEMHNSELNLIVASAAPNLVVMLEGSGNSVRRKDVQKAINIGVQECQTVIKAINTLRIKYGKFKREFQPNTEYEKLLEYVTEQIEAPVKDILSNYSHNKLSRDHAIRKVKKDLVENMRSNEIETNLSNIDLAFNKVFKKIFRDLVFETKKRCDGRTITELRPITCDVGLFKPLHGSAMFQRGQTQVLCTVTLDSLDSALKTDAISMLIGGIKEKNFFLHYEFPPYATNETGRVSGIGRRELGHGALAEKGLRPIIPKDYPFTIRLTSEVLESNGSSSMASVCGGSLALMDTGIPISFPAAGVAIGLLTDLNDTNNYLILTDILGIEDYLGDMDFKIAGTKNGLTALQADVKLPGIPAKIMNESLKQASTAMRAILEIMQKTIPEPRINKKENMPLSETLDVSVHERGKFLGVGGLNLKKILLETGVHIYSQSETTYCIFAPNKNAMEEAKEMINELLSKEKEPMLEFGAIYAAKIVEIRDSGLMVTLYPHMVPTLLPTSQLDQKKVFHPSALGFEIGQEIQVKYFGRDPASGQMRLSRKVLQEPLPYVRTLKDPHDTKKDPHDTKKGPHDTKKGPHDTKS